MHFVISYWWLPRLYNWHLEDIALTSLFHNSFVRPMLFTSISAVLNMIFKYENAVVSCVLALIGMILPAIYFFNLVCVIWYSLFSKPLALLAFTYDFHAWCKHLITSLVLFHHVGLPCRCIDRCISMPIYIGWYDDVAHVSYQQNLLIKVLRCCSAWSVWKPKLLLRLWPWLINANALSCSYCTEPSCIIIRPLCNSPDKTLCDVTFTRRVWRGK